MTQYQRIVNHLQGVGRFGSSYGELMRHCGTNWPHKRIRELESRGYSFQRWSSSHVPPRTMVALVAVPK